MWTSLQQMKAIEPNNISEVWVLTRHAILSSIEYDGG